MRRLGSCAQVFPETTELIAAVVPQLNGELRLELEKAILSWRPRRHNPSLEPSQRGDRLRRNRQDRLRLLRSFPKEFLSPETAKLLVKEERALPDTPDREIGVIKGGWAARS